MMRKILLVLETENLLRSYAPFYVILGAFLASLRCAPVQRSLARLLNPNESLSSGFGIIALLMVFAVTPAAAAAESDWFAITPEAAESWAVESAADPASVTLAPRTSGTEEPQEVLVLYTKASKAYRTAISRILTDFAAKSLAVRVTARLLPREAEAWEGLRRELEAQPRDLVFAMGSAATALAYAHLKGAPLPVVSVCAKDPVLLGQMPGYEAGSGTNMAFTSLNVPVAIQLSYLTRLKPGLKTIAVLFAQQNKSAVKTQLRPLAEAARARGITVLEVGVAERDKAAEELETLMPAARADMTAADPGLGNSIFWVTGSTSVFREIATINRLAGPVPVLSAVPDVVQAGEDSAVLSIGVGFDSNAGLAAHYALQILGGEADPGALTVGLVSPPDVAINFHRARAIGLKIPFDILEIAGTVYDPAGRLVRDGGVTLQTAEAGG